MASDYELGSLGSVANVRSGYAFKSTDMGDVGRPIIKIKNVVPPTVDISDCERVAERAMAQIPNIDRYAVDAGDILIAMTGATVGKVGRFPSTRERFYLNQRVGKVYLTAPNRADYRYLYFVLSQDSYVRQMSGAADGSAQANISGGQIERMEIPLPPLPKQRAIAHILGTLDDKIELNRRTSETLEALARALFKSWFVDFDPVRAKVEGRDPGLPKVLADLFPARFVDSELGEIPEGWEAGSLSEFFDIGLGGAWGEDVRSARATVAVRCLRGIDCHDLAEGRIPDVPVRWVSPRQATDRELPEGAILIEGSGSFCGRSVIWRHSYGVLLGGPIGYSNFCKRLDPRRAPAQAAICWMQMRQAYRDEILQAFRTGTAFPNFDLNGALSSLIVVVPPVRLAEAFDRVFALEKRLNLMLESSTLAALRDLLLPKLISGELRVKDLKERGHGD